MATKADKVTGATAGHLAGLDSNGNITDSGKASTDFDESGAATAAKAELAALIGTIPSTAVANYGGGYLNNLILS
jgi:hypothetical protein